MSIDHIDILSSIRPFLDRIATCRLAQTSKSLNALLKDDAGNYKQTAYNRLCELDATTDFFSVRKKWEQFNALYIIRKEPALRRWARVDGKRIRIAMREFRFGFYTGRRDEWHHCFLTLPPFWTNLGGRMQVTSFETRMGDDVLATRTFSGIFSTDRLAKILDMHDWHVVSI